MFPLIMPLQPGDPGVEAIARTTAAPAELLEGAAHFLQEDRGEDIARRVVRFLDET
jgi:pimeloyl-ACP methyl ester carboxylesterase